MISTRSVFLSHGTLVCQSRCQFKMMGSCIIIWYNTIVPALVVSLSVWVGGPIELGNTCEDRINATLELDLIKVGMDLPKLEDSIRFWWRRKKKLSLSSKDV